MYDTTIATKLMDQLKRFQRHFGEDALGGSRSNATLSARVVSEDSNPKQIGSGDYGVEITVSACFEAATLSDNQQSAAAERLD